MCDGDGGDDVSDDESDDDELLSGTSSAFSAAPNGFDAATLRAIRLVFDRKKIGAIMLDDIGISR